jgi:ribosomal-protein-serine acetyltransferase
MGNARPDRKKTELTDGRVLLRPYQNQYVKPTYQAIKESTRELAEWLPFAHEDYSIKETAAWVKSRPAAWKKGASYEFAIFWAEDRTIVGGCGLNGINESGKCANLGYWVKTSHTGKGIAPAATILLARWGFEVLALNRIEILVAVGNARSLRVAEKAGAKREGILRNRITVGDKVYDAVMHSLIPGDIKTAEK